MKVTIYNADGSVRRTLDCERCEPYCGSFKYVGNVIREGLEGTRYEGVITNLPVVAEDVPRDDANRDAYEYDVSLVSPSGQTIRRWENANSVSYLSDMVFFYHGEQWYSVFGNIVIETRRARMMMSIP